MVLTAKIEVPDNADWKTIEDAKARAIWKEHHTLKERMAKTNLDGKCGSCKYFVNCEIYMGAYAHCTVKDTLRERSRKACKTFYVKKEN